MKKLVKQIKIDHWILVGILLFIFLMRFPSLFEPFWYGDEGIFAAVARNLNFGGVMYADAWDNKPPMIYLTYATIFKFLGVSMFSLHLVTIIVVLATACIIYEIAQTILGVRRALVAAAVFGLLTSLRIVEGNLALTEIYMILPISAAMLIVIKRKFDMPSLFVAGVLFAIASLYKQVGALEAGAVGIFLFLSSQKPEIFMRKSLILALGFLIPFVITIAYFAPRNLVGEYIFAAYTYYRIYLGESPKYALLINVLKFMPIVSAIIYGLFKSGWRIKMHPRGVLRVTSRLHPGGEKRGKIDLFHLLLLWAAFSFLGSYFSGRTYGHYLVQAIPAFSLLLASISFKNRFRKEQIIFALTFFLPIIFLTKLLFTDFLSGGPINQISYWNNFLDYSSGRKGVDDYNDYFDRNVNSIMALSDFFAANNQRGTTAYIWGDYPWLYALADLRNPVRYVTSFHVFGVPNGRREVIGKLMQMEPKFIIKPPSSIGYFAELESILSARYTLLIKVENTDIFVRNSAR